MKSSANGSSVNLGFETRLWLTPHKVRNNLCKPSCVVRLLVEMLAPYKGRVNDPCCGSGGMFVQSEKFAEVHRHRICVPADCGEASNHTTH